MVARGIAGLGNVKSILKDLVLPAWDASAQPLWPPRRTTPADLAVLSAQTLERAGDPRLYTDEWWRVEEEKQERQRAEKARLEREEAERRASMPVPAHSDWGEQWEKGAAVRAARARP